MVESQHLVRDDLQWRPGGVLQCLAAYVTEVLLVYVQGR